MIDIVSDEEILDAQAGWRARKPFSSQLRARRRSPACSACAIREGHRVLLVLDSGRMRIVCTVTGHGLKDRKSFSALRRAQLRLTSRKFGRAIEAAER